MAYAQSSLHLEIQNLKWELAASQKRADKYAHQIASLSYELENLRNDICHSCKNKLGFRNASVAMPAAQGSTTTSVSASPIHSRSTANDTASIGLPHSPAAPQKITPTSLPVPEVASYRSSSQTTLTPAHPGPNEDIISSRQRTQPPKWSVIYNPKVGRALDLQLARVFTYDSPVNCVKMSPDGQRIAVGGHGKTYLHELQTGSSICVFVDRYVKDRINVSGVQFSPNGRLLATAGSDYHIRIWDITAKRMQAILKGHKHVVYNVAFSPNGLSLVSASRDESVRLWNIRDGSSKVLPVPVTISPDTFNSVTFSPDGRYVAAGSFDDSLWIWHSRTLKVVAKWRGHSAGVWSTEWTPDGKGLVSGGSDRVVKYWDVNLLGDRQGTVVNVDMGFPLVRRFVGHHNDVRSAAFFPDNTRWIVTGSHDQGVRVWDTQSGVCQLILQGHVDWVRGVDVSQRQNFLATAGIDGYVTVWKYRLL